MQSLHTHAAEKLDGSQVVDATTTFGKETHLMQRSLVSSKRRLVDSETAHGEAAEAQS
jgi:hypothetical protein